MNGKNTSRGYSFYKKKEIGYMVSFITMLIAKGTKPKTGYLTEKCELANIADRKLAFCF